jgi:hypothetical protein
VRDLTNVRKVEPLKIAYGEEAFKKIEFVQADLSDSQSLVKAIEGV